MNPEVAALPGPMLTEEQRRPLIDDAGRRLLTGLLEHQYAPAYNHTCGDRLTTEGLAAVRAFDAERAEPWQAGRPRKWTAAFVRHAMTQVPRYRGAVPTRFEDIPTVTRQDLVADPYAFVPDDHPLDDMVVYTTTGTSGGGLAYIASTPVVVAGYQAMLRAALRTRGLSLEGGAGRVAVAQVCWQRSTYTYASVSSFLGQAGVLKLNLNPGDWRSADDVVAFLDAIDPEIVTGDPVAFARLAELPVTFRPKALVSTAMTLLPGLAASMEERFGCPALDVYGMNEAGPIACGVAGGHAVLQPRLYVEILDSSGRALPVGERGEVTLTGGFNPALPLLRYRTGDHAALGAGGLLVGLEGRAPVTFSSLDGRAVNTIDITVALKALPIARYTLHQRADLSLVVGLDGGVEADVRAALSGLFGTVPVSVARLDGPETVTYSSEL